MSPGVMQYDIKLQSPQELTNLVSAWRSPNLPSVEGRDDSRWVPLLPFTASIGTDAVDAAADVLRVLVTGIDRKPLWDASTDRGEHATSNGLWGSPTVAQLGRDTDVGW